MPAPFVSRKLELLPAVLAVLAFVAFAAAFVYELLSYQTAVTGWAKGDLESRARLAAVSLEEPLRTQNIRELQRMGDEFAANGLRLRVTGVHGGIGTVFDTHRGADGDYLFSSRYASGDHDVIIGMPLAHVADPFRRALAGFVLAGLVGVAGVLTFFFVTYRQRVRIRELAKLEKFRREFIADVSHEIKTPLTGILGAVELLGEQQVNVKDGGEQRNVLFSLIEKESKRLNGLVQSILDLARLEREGEVLNLAETDLRALVKDAVEGLVPSARAAGISLVLAPPLRPPCGENPKVDAALVMQAVSNLIANAIRHSGSKDIVVAVEEVGRKAQIVVEDHGIGIPPAHAAQVFERFHRVDPARAAETGGAGLGLAIARRIARLHGGDLVLSSANPHGCRFVISLTIG